MSAVREVLMFVQEGSYGTPMLTTGAPTAGAFGYIRLDQGNAFTLRPVPTRQTIPFGGGFNMPALRVGVGATLTGNLRTLLYRSQAAKLMGWALTRIPTGRATPWATTDVDCVMPVGDLASMSLYHGVYDSCGTLKRTAYRGVKVSSLRLSCSEQSPVVVAEFGLVAQKPDPDDAFGGVDATGPDATEFPLPTGASDYPTDPYVLQHSTLKLDATVTDYAGFTLNAANRLQPHRFEGKFLRRCQLHGRDVTLAVPLLYKTTPDYLADFEAQNPMDVELTLNDGTGAAKFDLHTNAVYSEAPLDLPLDDGYMLNATLMSMWDSVAQSDFDFSYTEAP